MLQSEVCALDPYGQLLQKTTFWLSNFPISDSQPARTDHKRCARITWIALMGPLRTAQDMGRLKKGKICRMCLDLTDFTLTSPYMLFKS